MSELARLHSPESEQSVIGALLLDPSCADRISTLRPEHCFSEAHRLILAEILRMVSLGQQVDAVTVAEALDAAGLTEATGGLAYLGDIAQHTPSAHNVGRYAEIVVGKALERQLLGAADTIRATVEGAGTTRDKLMAAQSAVMGITEAVAAKAPQDIREVLAQAVSAIEDRREKKTPVIPTGFSKIDAMLSGGMRPGNVLIVAGRPGMGKTGLATNIAYNVASEGKTALILSMEMSAQELADRLIAHAGSAPLPEVLAGNMEGEAGDRILLGVRRLHDLPIVIDDQGGLTLFELASKARSVKRRKGGLGVVVVDYLQLMDGDGDSRNAQIEGISRGIKALAKELAVPVILLSQLNRSCEARTNRRPVASDLRESGAIEQDADVICMVYRDEIYNENSPDKGTAEVGIIKNRQGAPGTVRLAYIGQYTRFADLAHDWQPAEAPEEVKSKRRRFSDGY